MKRLTLKSLCVCVSEGGGHLVIPVTQCSMKRLTLKSLCVCASEGGGHLVMPVTQCSMKRLTLKSLCVCVSEGGGALSDAGNPVQHEETNFEISCEGGWGMGSK